MRRFDIVEKYFHWPWECLKSALCIFCQNDMYFQQSTYLILWVLIDGWLFTNQLTHWGRVTHICVDNIAIIGSDNGLSPGRRQAIIWTNAGIFLIGSWGTNFSELLIGIHTFSFKKIHLKMSSVKWRPFCLGLNVLINYDVCLPQSVSSPLPSWHDVSQYHYINLSCDVFPGTFT